MLVVAGQKISPLGLTILGPMNDENSLMKIIDACPSLAKLTFPFGGEALPLTRLDLKKLKGLQELEIRLVEAESWNSFCQVKVPSTVTQCTLHGSLNSFADDDSDEFLKNIFSTVKLSAHLSVGFQMPPSDLIFRAFSKLTQCSKIKMGDDKGYKLKECSLEEIFFVCPNLKKLSLYFHNRCPTVEEIQNLMSDKLKSIESFKLHITMSIDHPKTLDNY